MNNKTIKSLFSIAVTSFLILACSVIVGWGSPLPAVAENSMVAEDIFQESTLSTDMSYMLQRQAADSISAAKEELPPGDEEEQNDKDTPKDTPSEEAQVSIQGDGRLTNPSTGTPLQTVQICVTASFVISLSLLLMKLTKKR